MSIKKWSSLFSECEWSRTRRHGTWLMWHGLPIELHPHSARCAIWSRYVRHPLYRFIGFSKLFAQYINIIFKNNYVFLPSLFAIDACNPTWGVWYTRRHFAASNIPPWGGRGLSACYPQTRATHSRWLNFLSHEWSTYWNFYFDICFLEKILSYIELWNFFLLQKLTIMIIF